MATNDDPKLAATSGDAPVDGGAAAPAPGASDQPVIDQGGGEAPPDDGFSPEERQQFADMQREEAGEAAPAPAGGDPAPDAAAQAAAAAAAAAAPAAGADDDDDDADVAAAPVAGQPAKDPRKARVSLGKFLRTEERAKKAETELTAERERTARFDERMKILSEALATPKADGDQQQQDDDPMPDREADVFAYLGWADRRTAKLEKALADMQQGKQSEQADQSISTAYMDDARAFATREPNFVPAYQHLMNTRVRQMALINFGKNLSAEGVTLTMAEQQKIKTAVAQEEKELAASALRVGKSPAQLMFEIAQSMGFQPPAADPAAPGNGAAPTNGAAPAGGRPTASAAAPTNGANGKQPTVKDEIDRLKNGQDAALSLSHGGGAPNNPLTAQKLADMPQDEFNRLADTLTAEEFQRLVEGQP